MPSGGTFDTLTGVGTSVAEDIRESEGYCRENLLLGKEERAGQRYYKGFASAHIETPPFIFGKVDVSRSAIHWQNGWRLAPHKESKAPPLQLSSYRSSTWSGRRSGSDNGHHGNFAGLDFAGVAR